MAAQDPGQQPIQAKSTLRQNLFLAFPKPGTLFDLRMGADGGHGSESLSCRGGEGKSSGLVKEGLSWALFENLPYGASHVSSRPRDSPEQYHVMGEAGFAWRVGPILPNEAFRYGVDPQNNGAVPARWRLRGSVG